MSPVDSARNGGIQNQLGLFYVSCVFLPVLSSGELISNHTGESFECLKKSGVSIFNLTVKIGFSYAKKCCVGFLFF